MRYQIPKPISAGIMLSYKCSAECKHCLYACSPKWSGDWMKEKDLYRLLYNLSPKVEASMFGSSHIGVNSGIHFSGGEPFLNFELLTEGIRMAKELDIPSIFVETNSVWATNEDVTREKLNTLKNQGMNGILVSVNPFFVEHVPFDRVKRAAKISYEIFGSNTIIYQPEFFYEFNEMGLSGTLPFDAYIAGKSKVELTQKVEFFIGGRAPYKLESYGLFPHFPANLIMNIPCNTSLIRSWHNHFDNYGNFQPGFCGGISLGNWNELNQLVEEGVELDDKPILKYLIEDDFRNLLEYAKNKGYSERKNGYLSKCHLCTDIRKFLAKQKNYKELQPRAFYAFLEE